MHTAQQLVTLILSLYSYDTQDLSTRTQVMTARECAVESAAAVKALKPGDVLAVSCVPVSKFSRGVE